MVGCGRSSSIPASTSIGARPSSMARRSSFPWATTEHGLYRDGVPTLLPLPEDAAFAGTSEHHMRLSYRSQARFPAA